MHSSTSGASVGHETPQSTLISDAIERLDLVKDRGRENHFRHPLAKFALLYKVQQNVLSG